MFLGIDIGTASSKAVVVNELGTVFAAATRPHRADSPRPGWFEHDARGVWWNDLVSLTRDVLETISAESIAAVCVSGIGPCVLAADGRGDPLRPAILYGIDTRAEREIDELTAEIGVDELLRHTGNRLTTQAVSPKLRWIARHEPDVWQQTVQWYCASNWLVRQLTGVYVLDEYTASTSDCLYDLLAGTWWSRGWQATGDHLERPRLAWPAEIVGEVTPEAAAETGLHRGTPVLAGTVDAMAEAYSAGCRDIGDTMVMYGSTLFLIQLVSAPAMHDGLWAANGRVPGSYAIAAGMATSGLVTTWLANLAGAPVGDLIAEAAAVAPGSDGLVLLPYFSGERTPLFDPRARGTWLGLTLAHTRGHLYRSALEGVAYGLRHNLEAMTEAGATPRRLVAVGGGTRGSLWTRIISNVTGLPQDLPKTTIGASYGDARMAADACGVDTTGWNKVIERLEPDPETASIYDELYGIYRRTYPALVDDMHRLAALSGRPVD